VPVHQPLCVILAALAVARRSMPAAMVLLAVGALPLAITTWWSMTTPVLAVLVLLLGCSPSETSENLRATQHRSPDWRHRHEHHRAARDLRDRRERPGPRSMPSVAGANALLGLHAALIHGDTRR
jgi:hypothetical protein